MTYNVFSGTLNPTHSLTPTHGLCTCILHPTGGLPSSDPLTNPIPKSWFSPPLSVHQQKTLNMGWNGLGVVGAG